MINALRTHDDRRWYRLSLAALVLAAWLALAVWGLSPFAELLGHRDSGAIDLATPVRLLVFVFGWTLMTVAMMLPASLPLVNLFRRFVLHRPDGARLLLLLIVGYLVVWVEFGLLAYLGDGVLHFVLNQAPALQAASGGIAAVILLAAGIYQFTPLKTMCLEKCRSPYSFLVSNWRGRHASWDALRLGMRHGLFCLGCCWTLMLLMFAIGGANLGWMLALGAVMGAERATRWGRRLTRPLGGALVLWALLNLAGFAPFPSG
jgi:predicted metal-binding membrane protein